MITQVDPLYIGDEEACAEFTGPHLHALKHPCYMRAVVTPREKNDPEYLVARRGDDGNDLFLNLIDPPVPLFQIASFLAALEWIDTRAMPPLIHCNKGASRAPSIALLWMASHEMIPCGSFSEARTAFEKLYTVAGVTVYSPGAGIATFLTDHWDELLS